MSDALNKELEKIHLEISELMGLSREHLNFEYQKDGEKTILNLITINPRHKQSFLFNSTQGFGEMDALHKMLDLVKNQKKGKDTYTIQWALNDNQELHTSYFRGKNIYEVLDKFYFGKDISTTVIFSVSLNPIS